MPRHLLLTGATGALGPHIAAELLTANAADRIAVLMRPIETRSGPAVGERFSAWVTTVASLLPPKSAVRHAVIESMTGEDGRLYPVLGDLCADGLGLDATTDAALRRDTEAIVHAAADTRFSAPPAEQWEANVEGTRRMLEWAAGCPHLAHFMLVSSTYVAGTRTGMIDETAPAERPGFVNHYQYTKWEAEQLALTSGLPISVARISLVMGSHANGFVHRPGALHNIIRWFGRGLVPMLPGMSHSTVDLISAETAARCLARAATVLPSTLKAPGASQVPIWHIAAGRQATLLSDLVDFVFEQFAEQSTWRRKAIPRAAIVDEPTFEQFRASVDAQGHPAFSQVMDAVSSFLPDLLYPKIYDTSSAEALWGGPLPLHDWRETMGRVIQFCCLRAGVENRRIGKPAMARG